jgi:hypothetical protein
LAASFSSHRAFAMRCTIGLTCSACSSVIFISVVLGRTHIRVKRVQNRTRATLPVGHNQLMAKQ